MSKQIKNKCIHLFLLLFTFLLILNPNTVFAEDEIPTNDLPNVVSYKIISSDTYINNYTREQEIGIIVEFDSLEGIDVENSTISALTSITKDPDGPNDLPKVADNVPNFVIDNNNYSPGDNELLFKINFDGSRDFVLAEQVIIFKIVLDGKDIPVNTESSIMLPDEGYRVYYDCEYPEFESGEVTSSTGTNDSYQFQEALTLDIHFDEPVMISEIEKAIKFCVYPEGVEAITSFTEFTGNETKNISLSYTFDENLRTNYTGTVKVLIDKNYITDIAGNKLWIPYLSNGYFEIKGNDDVNDIVEIKSIYPTITQADPPGGDYNIDIYFNDDDTDDNFDHLTKDWKVGIFLSDEIRDKKNIIYNDYQLLYTNSENNIKSHLVYNNKYHLYIDIEHDEFKKADDKDQKWYFYFYIEDADGNKIYKEIQDVYIDRAPPEINIDGDYLTPLTNQAIQFEITDSFISDFSFNIKDMNGYSIFNDDVDDTDYDGYNRRFYFEGFLNEDYVFPDYLSVTSGTGIDLSKTISGTVNVEKLITYINENTNNSETPTAISLNTETYELVIKANDDEHPNVISEENKLFTIDKTPPTVNIETTEGDVGTISSYKLTFSDTNGKEVITTDNPDLIYDDDNEITLYYEFVVADSLNYPEAQENHKKVYTENEVEIDVPYGDLNSGTYRLNIKGVDRAGNKVTVVSDDTFTVPDAPTGTIICDDFSNNLNLNANYTVASPYNNLEYRISVDKHGADCTINSESWQTLYDLNGEKTLSINLDESLEQGEYDVYIQYRFELNDAYFVSDIVCDSFIYDIEGPTANINYSTKELTYEPVNATLVDIGDNYTDADDIIVSLEGIEGSEVSEGTKVVTLNTANDKFTFVLTDQAGNVSKYVAHAPLISSDAKPAKVIYNTTAKTPNNVTVHLEFDAMNDNEAKITLLMDELDPAMIEKIEVTSEGGIYYYTFGENGNYNFEYIDDINRTGYITAYIHNIDRTKPTAEISYNFTELTNNDVYGYINPSETIDYEIYDGTTISGVSINPIVTGQSIDGETIKYTFTKNGSITVLLKDEAGNDNSCNLEVNWIDKTPPVITVEYSDNYSANPNEKTRDNITVEITADEPINILNNNQKPTRIFTENEEYTFMVEDKAGNHTNVNINIVNIDKSEPIVELDYSTEELTNENVTITMTSNVPITILNNNGSNELIFTENGRKYFQYKDDFDRKYIKFVDVTNIDKQPPVIKFDKYKNIFVEVGGDIDLNEGFSIFDDVDGTITNYTINDDNVNLNRQGTYEIEYIFTDTAGNEVIVKRKVEVLSELTLVINGQKGTNNLLMLDDLDLNVQVYYAKGSYQIQFKEGILRTGKFKKNKQSIRNGRATADKGGYVTFYVQDQERNWKLVRSYIYE